MRSSWAGGSEELRALVREVIREALPAAPAGSAAPAAPATLPSSGASAATVEPVSIRSDADLSAFVQRVLDAAADPMTEAALRNGRIRFVLAGPVTPPVPVGYRVEKGAVTERHVRAAAEFGGPLVLGRSAVLTPLARDRARTLGLTIEKED